MRSDVSISIRRLSARCARLPDRSIGGIAIPIFVHVCLEVFLKPSVGYKSNLLEEITGG